MGPSEPEGTPEAGDTEVCPPLSSELSSLPPRLSPSPCPSSAAFPSSWGCCCNFHPLLGILLPSLPPNVPPSTPRADGFNPHPSSVTAQDSPLLFPRFLFISKERDVSLLVLPTLLGVPVLLLCPRAVSPKALDSRQVLGASPCCRVRVPSHSKTAGGHSISTRLHPALSHFIFLPHHAWVTTPGKIQATRFPAPAFNAGRPGLFTKAQELVQGSRVFAGK